MAELLLKFVILLQCILLGNELLKCLAVKCFSHELCLFILVFGSKTVYTDVQNVLKMQNRGVKVSCGTMLIPIR